MKQIIYILLFLYLAFLGKAQVVFCPPGAEWHYSFFWGFPYKIENEKIQYIRDSTLGSNQVKVLSHRKSYKGYNPPENAITLIKQNGDTVFFRSHVTQHSWQVLYNFAALPGQSWKTTIQLTDPDLPPAPIYNYTVVVDSVKFITENSFSLKTLFVTYKFTDTSQTIVTHTEQINERFGARSFLFPFENFYSISDYDYIYQFLCYQDNAFGLKQFSSKPCDYSDYVGINDEYSQDKVLVYPNPTQTVLNLKNMESHTTETVEISDCLGRTVLMPQLNNGEIDIHSLPAGLYQLRLCADQNSFVIRFLKE